MGFLTTFEIVDILKLYGQPDQWPVQQSILLAVSSSKFAIGFR